jgi:hypothetical protein
MVKAATHHANNDKSALEAGDANGARAEARDDRQFR